MRGNFDRLLQKRFRTGKRFTTSYLKYFERAQDVKLDSEEACERLNSTQRMWFDYAMSTNQRGDDLLREIETYQAVAGRRYLDIGCGFGGCLIAAVQRGARAVGIEIDRERAAFSRANVADFGLDIPVVELDALAPGIEEKLGSFDVITCNDVAEHVQSAEDLLRNIRRLLRPGGLAYLEIPNGECIDFVAHDGHFGLFGITLLEREQARQYHWDRFHHAYDVGEYWSLQEYLQFFEGAGLCAKLIASLYHPTRAMSELEEQLALLERARVRGEYLDGAFAEYRARLDRDLKQSDEDTFRNRYLRNFWTFLARLEDR